MQPSRNRRAELQHPTPHRFIGDVEPALGEQFLHVAVAQRKAEIEPDRVLDDLGRKTMAVIAERSHAATLTLRAALARPVSVTKPDVAHEEDRDSETKHELAKLRPAQPQCPPLPQRVKRQRVMNEEAAIEQQLRRSVRTDPENVPKHFLHCLERNQADGVVQEEGQQQERRSGSRPPRGGL